MLSRYSTKRKPCYSETPKRGRIDILRAITINGYKAADVIKERGPIKAELF